MNFKRIDELIEKLSEPLPGIEAQRRLSPPERFTESARKPAKKSAVLILLYPDEEKTKTVFIKRTEYDGFHSGQVSLPGGMFKESDGNLSYTALRETMEETGIVVNPDEIVGKLTPLHIPVSNVDVYPYVAVHKRMPFFRHDPFEVKYLIHAGIDQLQDPGNQKFKIMAIGGREIEIPYFDINGDHIWGATAMIVSEFLEIAGRIRS